MLETRALTTSSQDSAFATSNKPICQDTPPAKDAAVLTRPSPCGKPIFHSVVYLPFNKGLRYAFFASRNLGDAWSNSFSAVLKPILQLNAYLEVFVEIDKDSALSHQTGRTACSARSLKKTARVPEDVPNCLAPGPGLGADGPSAFLLDVEAEGHLSAKFRLILRASLADLKSYKMNL